MKDIHKAILFNSTWTFLLTQAVLVPFMLSKNISMEEIFYVQAVHSLTLCAVNLFSSYLSDRFSRKITLYAACLLRATGGILFCLSTNFYDFIISYIFIGLGNGLFWGSNIALLYDADSQLKHDRTHAEKMLGLNFFCSKLSIVLSALLGGIIAMYSFKLLAVINAITSCLPILLLFNLRHIQFQSFDRTKISTIKQLYQLFSGSLLLKLSIVASVCYGLMPFFGVYFSQAIFAQQNLSLVYFGYIMAINQIISALLAKNIDKISRNIGIISITFLLALLPIIAFWGLSTLNITIVIGSLVIIELCRALNETTVSSVIHSLVNDDMRSSTNATMAFNTYLGTFILSMYIGKWIEAYGLVFSIYSFIYFYSLIFFIVMLPMVVCLYKYKASLSPATELRVKAR